jgi:hypothetical protein
MKMSEKLKTYEVEGGVIIHFSDYDIAVFDLRLDCPGPNVRIVSFAGLECEIEYPTPSHKNIFLKMHKNTQAQGSVTFYKVNMNHVLIFQALMDFLTSIGKNDSQTIFKLYVDEAQQPVTYEILNAIKIYAEEEKP